MLGDKNNELPKIVCKIDLCQEFTNIVMTLPSIAFVWVWFPINRLISKKWHEESVGSQN